MAHKRTKDQEGFSVLWTSQAASIMSSSGAQDWFSRSHYGDLTYPLTPSIQVGALAQPELSTHRWILW